MPQEGYDSIPVKSKTRAELLKRKMKKQAKLGKPVTWDDFLLDATGGVRQ